MLRTFINVRQDLVNIHCQGPKGHTFYYSAIKDWNNLPEKLETIQDNKKFKFELKKHLQLDNQSKDKDVYMYY